VAGIDYKLNDAGAFMEMSYGWEDTILNNIALSITTKKGDWFHKPAFGSRLHTIKKNTAGAVELVKEYVKEATQWIIDIGRATEINIIAEREPNNLHRINFRVTAKQANGLIVPFNDFIEVI